MTSNRPSGTQIANEAERQRTDWSGVIIVAVCLAAIVALVWRMS